MNKEKGFTLIELLVAMVIMIIVIHGFMLALLTYYDIDLRNRFKKEATQTLKDIAGFFESVDYTFVSNLSTPTIFDNKHCVDIGSERRCGFEYSDPYLGIILDTDNDSVPDFYDPYNGANQNQSSNPRSNLASWLTIAPTSSGVSCNVTVPFNCVYAVSGKELYVAVTVSKVVDAYNREAGRAIGITVWYFEPKTNRYKGFRTLVFKEKP